MNRALLTIPAWLLVAGCFIDKEATDDGPYCEETPTVVTLEEVTELGFSGADLLVLAEGSFEEELTWLTDDSTTTVTVDVAYAEGEVRYVTSEAVYPDEGETSIAIGIECEDYLELDVTIAIATVDGSLAESLDTTISSYDGTVSTTRQSFAPEEIQGTYEYTEMDPSEYDELELGIAVEFDEVGCSGEMTVTTQGCDDDCEGDECTCWASNGTVASWPIEDLQ